MTEFGISAYDSVNHTGLVRHIYIRKAFVTGQIMVCLVINGDEIPKFHELVDDLLRIDGLKSVVININQEKTNVILGLECKTLWGADYIEDVLCGVKIRLSPLSFYQVNHDCAELLYNKASEYVGATGSETVLDLYCGAGTIGLSMANKVKKIIGVEIIPEAIEDAKVNAKNNNIENCEFYCGDAKDAVKILKDKNIEPDAVILDPPRKGCDREVLEYVAEMKPKKIVYVSCDVSTQARDCAILKELGYETKEVTPVDMFPRTSHTETVALLSRQKVDEHIYFDVNVQDLPKTARTTATYPEIKAYVKDKYGLNVTSLNIAQVKEKHGFEKRENYNKGKDGHRVPNCPPEKEKAIEDAFKHFGML